MGQTQPNPTKIALVGLPNSGKTEFLSQLKLPTEHDKTGEQPIKVATYKSTEFRCFELGEEKYHNFQKQIFESSNGIIFIFDSSNEPEFPKVKEELQRITAIEKAKTVPIVLMANKQDRPSAVTKQSILSIFEPCFTNPDQPYLIQPVVIWTKDGLVEGFEWLATKLGSQGSYCNIL
jgi:small GTP-binding protein